jgi:hypothetical protein
MGKSFLETHQVQLVMAPVDANDGATTGDYFDMSKCSECEIVVAFGDGTAGSDLDIALYQSDDNAGTTTAVLNCLETGRIYTKYAATYAAYAALTAWTQVTQETADEKHEPDDNGEAVGLMSYRVLASDLTDGYRYIRADLTDPGQAKIAAALYIGTLYDQGDPALTPHCL